MLGTLEALNHHTWLVATALHSPGNRKTLKSFEIEIMQVQ
jgi:hypothetical protein